MGKILLLSDTHRDDQTFLKIKEKYPDAVLKIHAGDSCCPKDDPLIQDMLVVKGNHDRTDFPEYIVHPPFFICHGHTFRVYATFDQMIEQAKAHHCSIIIHGHTHIPYDKIICGVRIINPGSVLINRGDYGFGTYAIMDEYSGKVNFYHHLTHEDVSEIVLADGIRTLAQFRELLQGLS